MSFSYFKFYMKAARSYFTRYGLKYIYRVRLKK